MPGIKAPLELAQLVAIRLNSPEAGRAIAQSTDYAERLLVQLETMPA
jgi:hypothetical protein